MRVIKLKEHPELLRVIRRVAPKYRKHSAIVTHANKYTNHGSFWDGGSRKTAYLIAPNGVVSAIPGPTAPPQFSGGDPVTIDIPAGYYVVSVGTFCGKPAAASITIGE